MISRQFLTPRRVNFASRSIRGNSKCFVPFSRHFLLHVVLLVLTFLIIVVSAIFVATRAFGDGLEVLVTELAHVPSGVLKITHAGTQCFGVGFLTDKF